MALQVLSQMPSPSASAGNGHFGDLEFPLGTVNLFFMFSDHCCCERFKLQNCACKLPFLNV